ncbi:D-alanyl-D-alanine carboxypeptidase family protein [Streptomyces sp. G1]|uniref:D-alanyl-D-alanine carboxypeptidase family protein n=1 Tax=Streptomyces sp. G1 TaxID=361572 RepID=UPI00202DF22E|nr:serine hydrolase [Streptomyces sp. G1]MCM1969111.1 serine hydrolase [Streptomyces sp. G1]
MISNLLRRSRAALAITVATGALIAVASPAQAVTGPPTLAKSAFLMDGTTGATLANKAGDTKLQGASTTKIMTAYVVLTSPGIDLNKKVTVQQEYLDYVVREGASTARLKAGATPTVRQLLYGMMLPSGCDAAYALADTFGSGASRQDRINDFIAKMNAKAKTLGMTNTYYDAFDGISQHGNNKITARDLAKLTRAAMKGSTFKSIVKTTSYSTGGTSTSATWSTTNLLITPGHPYQTQGAIGVKTGSGSVAGQCLVFSVTRNGKTIIGVLLNSTDRYPDAIALTNWALGAPAGAPALQRSTTSEPIPDVLD